MRRVLLLLGVCIGGAQLQAQAVASVCKDGTTSATTGRGACSGHGGVDSKATAKAKSAEKATEAKAKAAQKAADKADVAKKQAQKAETKAASTEVTCSDGSKSAGGRGACSGHGGIAKSNSTEKKAEVAEKKADAAEKKAANAEARSTAPAPKPQPPAARTRTATVTQPSSGRSEDNNPTGAIAKCKDGLYSHSANRRGACSRHGGVANWM